MKPATTSKQKKRRRQASEPSAGRRDGRHWTQCGCGSYKPFHGALERRPPAEQPVALLVERGQREQGVKTVRGQQTTINHHQRPLDFRAVQLQHDEGSRPRIAVLAVISFGRTRPRLACRTASGEGALPHEGRESASRGRGCSAMAMPKSPR